MDFGLFQCFAVRHMAFFAGSLLAVLIILTVIDEDVLSVEHVLALMTVLGLVITVCRVLIPNEVRRCLYRVGHKNRSLYYSIKNATALFCLYAQNDASYKLLVCSAHIDIKT